MSEFKNKVVIVTGASSGIGAETAITFSKQGANVTMVGRNQVKLNNVAKQVAEVGSAPLVIKGDVANDDDARRIIRETIERFGKLDVLVNNAGVVRYGTLLKGDALKSYDDIFGINLRAVIHLSQLAAPYLVKTKGNIVNISSVSAQMHWQPSFNVYSTSKAALDHFTRGTAQELAQFGVRVNAISPGPVKTDIIENSGSLEEFDLDAIKTPLGRISNSDEIAELILYMASDRARGITGSIFLTDNGSMLIVK